MARTRSTATSSPTSNCAATHPWAQSSPTRSTRPSGPTGDPQIHVCVKIFGVRLPTFFDANVDLAPSHGVDLGHDLLAQALEVVECLRHRYVGERRPEQRHGEPRLAVALEDVGDLCRGPDEQVAALALRGLIALLIGDDEPD